MKPQHTSAILLVVGLALVGFGCFDVLRNTDDSYNAQGGAESSFFALILGALLVFAGILGFLRMRKR